MDNIESWNDSISEPSNELINESKNELTNDLRNESWNNSSRNEYRNVSSRTQSPMATPILSFSPRVIVLLSVIPGFGHIFLGQYKKGNFWWLVCCFLYWISYLTNFLSLIPALLLHGLLCLDGYRLSRRLKNGESFSEWESSIKFFSFPSTLWSHS